MSGSLRRVPRNHLTPFTEGPRAWLVLARNALPVIGVYALGWSADIVIFQLWFDGLTALGAMLAFQMRALAHNEPKIMRPPPGVPPHFALRLLALVWFLIWLLLGLPYWFILFFFSIAVFEGGLWHLPLGHVSVIVALVLVLVSNILEAHRRGYVGLSDADIRLEFNWEFNLHLARIVAIILVTFFLRAGLILVLALALSYIEIYPMRALKFFGGDRTLETDNEHRSPD